MDGGGDTILFVVKKNGNAVGGANADKQIFPPGDDGVGHHGGKVVGQDMDVARVLLDWDEERTPANRRQPADIRARLLAGKKRGYVGLGKDFGIYQRAHFLFIAPLFKMPRFKIPLFKMPSHTPDILLSWRAILQVEILHRLKPTQLRIDGDCGIMGHGEKYF
jgi:hypothetical protein